MGNQHCRLDGTGGTECAAGPVPSDVLCARPLAAGCEGRIGRGTPASPWAVTLAMLALLAGAMTLRQQSRVRARRSSRPGPEAGA